MGNMGLSIGDTQSVSVFSWKTDYQPLEFGETLFLDKMISL
jgi:hypothetical protein